MRPTAGSPSRANWSGFSVGYAGGTINLHDGYYVLDGDQVVDVWPVVARGAGRAPALAAGRAAT